MARFAPRDRRGNYMMLMGAMLPMFVGFAALAVDVSYINMAHVQAQHTADAASHAAFVGFRSSNDFDVGNAAADFILEQNLVGNREGVIPAGQLRYGTWDFDAGTFTESGDYVNAAQATVVRSVGESNALDLFFAPLLGYSRWDVDGNGVTAGRTRQIMLVQDVSCSFEGKDILNARDADIAFLEYLNNNPYPDDMLGMSLFGGRSWYPVLQELDHVASGYGAAGAAPDGKPNSMLARFQALDYCDGLPDWSTPSPTWGSRCNTTQARGLFQAREQFTAHGDSREFQAVILISDGLPNQGLVHGGNGRADSERAINQLWGRDGAGNDRRDWSVSVVECPSRWSRCSGDGPGADHYTTTTYDTTFDGGVHVWTVTFNDGGGDFSWMGTLTRGMGRAYETPNSDDLDDIMIEIASSIPVVLTE